MILGVAVTAGALLQILRRGAPEIGMVMTIGVSGALLLWSVTQGQQLFGRISDYYTYTVGMGQEQIEILFKSLGVCFLVQMTADACRDFGESAVATKVELAGKITVLTLALPLFDQLLQVVAELIG